MVKVSPLEIYKLLPGKNCGACGIDTCMAFASALIERDKNVEDCTLFQEEKYKKKMVQLIELMTPPVKEVIIGTGDRAVAIGGEEVMYRHELTFFNQTALFIDVSDDLPADELAERIGKITKFHISRVGQDLYLNGIAIRSKSGDAARFGDAVLTAAENSDLPLILCSFDPEHIEIGAGIAFDKRPLIYAATKDNWEKMAEIAKTNNCPVVAYSPGDLQGLLDLVSNLTSRGVEDIVLDLGTYPMGEKFGEMISNMEIIRRLAIEKNVKSAGFPILSVPLVAWMTEEDPVAAGMAEAALAASLLLKYSDAMILHSYDMWEVLPILTLRQNIYTDPRVPIQVDSGIFPMGKPDENSPVLMTTNFALTYYTVASDLEASKVNAWLVVVNTEGLAVEPAMAGAKLTPSLVADTLKNSKAGEKVKHKKLIIPGMAARISGDVEDESGWEVMVGPLDSSRIPGYLEEKWK